MSNLYDQDVYLWSQRQAKLLREAARAGSNSPVDWEHVAEEIESLGNEQAHAVESHIARVIEHLLLLQASPAMDPRRGWIDSVSDARSEIEHRLKRNPSLGREVAGMIAWAMPHARKKVRGKLELYGERPRTDLEALSYSEEQVLGDWWPRLLP
ncbi:MAG: DUF29 domain-containing protein [Acetobacteraceae bacterium]|nr:DUF29 domain-containing protein [Acetobacteraceae bacterium]MBV8521861.1 DUF29 domain-containing protein [Acetobacteraceae bacterium]